MAERGAPPKARIPLPAPYDKTTRNTSPCGFSFIVFIVLQSACGLIPNYQKNHSDKEEKQARKKDTAIPSTAEVFALSFIILRVRFLVFFIHWDKEPQRPFENVPNRNEDSFAADEQQTEKEHHQQTCRRKRVAQHRYVDIKTLGGKDKKYNQCPYAKTNKIFF